MGDQGISSSGKGSWAFGLLGGSALGRTTSSTGEGVQQGGRDEGRQLAPGMSEGVSRALFEASSFEPDRQQSRKEAMTQQLQGQLQQDQAQGRTWVWKRGGPVVLQSRPAGYQDCNYQRGEVQCAAAAVLTLGLQAGLRTGRSQAQSIMALSQGLVGARGSTAAKLCEMVRRMGLTMPGPALIGDVNTSAIADQITQHGHKFIAQVGVQDGQGNKGSHYVVIDRVDANGNFVIADPQSGTRKTWTPAQLEAKVRSARGAGVLIPVGPPATQSSGPSLNVPASFVGRQSPSEYAERVLEMLNSGRLGKVTRGTTLVQALALSGNEKDAAALAIINRRLATLEELKPNERELADELFMRLHSGNAAAHEEGTRMFHRMLGQPGPQRKAALAVFIHIMLTQPGGGMASGARSQQDW